MNSDSRLRLPVCQSCITSVLSVHYCSVTEKVDTPRHFQLSISWLQTCLRSQALSAKRDRRLAYVSGNFPELFGRAKVKVLEAHRRVNFPMFLGLSFIRKYAIVCKLPGWLSKNPGVNDLTCPVNYRKSRPQGLCR